MKSAGKLGEIAADLFVQSPRVNAVKCGEIRIKKDLVTTNEKNPVLDPLDGNRDFGGHRRLGGLVNNPALSTL